MRNINELQAFSHGQITAAIQIIEIMDATGINKNELLSIRKHVFEAAQTGIKKPDKQTSSMLQRPCCDDEINEELKRYKEKQAQKRKAKRLPEEKYKERQALKRKSRKRNREMYQSLRKKN